MKPTELMNMNSEHCALKNNKSKSDLQRLRCIGAQSLACDILVRVSMHVVRIHWKMFGDVGKTLYCTMYTSGFFFYWTAIPSYTLKQ